jgi:hypothetical protein
VFSKSFTQPARFVESTCCLVLYLAEKRKTKKQSQKNYKEGGKAEHAPAQAAKPLNSVIHNTVVTQVSPFLFQ